MFTSMNAVLFVAYTHCKRRVALILRAKKKLQLQNHERETDEGQRPQPEPEFGTSYIHGQDTGVPRR